MINCSANELESLVRRASRGAGMAWGLAEEAGKAVRWLELRGLTAVPLMRHHLDANAGKSFEEVAPPASADVWAAPGGMLCPIVTGATISDQLESLKAGAPVLLAAVACPLLLAGVVGRAAEATGKTLSLSWDTSTLVLSPGGPDTGQTRSEALAALSADAMSVDADCSPGVAPQGAPPAMGSLPIAKADLDALKALAFKTYVPETEQSRLSGAGAGLSDND